ncbi:MAG TPA: hypothetical protein VFT50_16990 [Baekduia sp.]|nr:hypothetical protein [Baekduia sp.]
MSEPPPSADQRNVVDPDVLAQRRARRAEVGEDATLEMRLFDAEQRIGEVEAERDALRSLLEVQERRAAGEDDGDGEPIEVSAAAAELASVRERLERTEARLSVVVAERDRARSALYQARMSAEAASARRTALEREHAELRQQLDRRTAVARDAAAAVAGARAALRIARERGADTGELVERLERESAAFAEQVEAVEGAVAAVRTRLGVAIGALRERLAGERERRAAAEAALEAERQARAAAEAARGSEREARAAAEAGVVAEREARAAVEWELGAERDAKASLEAGLQAARDGRAEAERELRDTRASLEADVRAEREGRAAVEAVLSDERAARADVEGRLVAAEEARAAAEGQLADERQVRASVEAILSDERAARADVEDRLAEVRDTWTATEAALIAERDAARAAQERLEQELAQQLEVEASLRAELDGVRAELASVRAGHDERAEQMAARVEAVAGLAAQLREGVARERAAEVEALVASLEAMQARMAELQEAVADTGRLRAEVEAERAARWAAEAELDAERERASEDRTARAAAEARLAEVEAELEELRTAGRVSADPESIASLREALGRLQAAEPAEPAAAPSLGFDLAAAAERLRAAVPEPAAEDERGDDEDGEGAEAMPLSADGGWSTKARAAIGDEAGAGEADAAALSPVRLPLPRRTPVTAAGPWLRDTLVALAADEPEIAELLMAALLPAQAGLLSRPLRYDLLPAGGMAQRVVLTPAEARLETPGDGPGGADARVAGPLAALVPLVAGGAARRLPGASIQGRWALRRLLKARRAPLGLGELAAAGTAPSNGLLLTVLARAVDPAWIAGETLAVDVAPQGAERWRVEATGSGPLTVRPAADVAPPTATLHVPAGRLAAVLAGTAVAGEASVEGDMDAVTRLLAWLDRAQRAER